MNDMNPTESVDVVVIGAGISGIGAAHHLRSDFPEKKILILEARDSIGGTWDLFRYPGVRSDSDLHTYAYEFKPWRNRSAIAEGDLIRDYLAETVDEFGLGGLIRFRHRVIGAEWSSQQARWSLLVAVTDGEGNQTTKTISTHFVFSATGYYRYDQGYNPHFEGQESFKGDILHPQHWPEHYDYSGKRVVIIGSGATAVTMLPAMLMGEGAASHMTMLQRTPSYIASIPRVDKIALLLSKVLGAKAGYRATRWKNVWIDFLFVSLLSRYPKFGRKLLRKWALKELPDNVDMDTHFNPPYDPWDQRLCITPDGEFFKALRSGSADIVTDHIARFTEDGILLESGKKLEADTIITATGLAVQMLGGVRPVVDGSPIDLHDTVLYRGCLPSGVPNWAMFFGYTKATWTMRLGNVCRLVRDVIRRMDESGNDIIVPVVPDTVVRADVVDLSAGYLQRSLHELPRRGTEMPWLMHTTFVKDNRLFKGRLVDDNLHFSKARAAAEDTSTVGVGA